MPLLRTFALKPITRHSPHCIRSMSTSCGFWKSLNGFDRVNPQVSAMSTRLVSWALPMVISVLALIDGADVGTIFELGYAHAKGIPVVAFAQSMNEEDMKMIVGSGAHVVSDFTTAVFMTAWL